MMLRSLMLGASISTAAAGKQAPGNMNGRSLAGLPRHPTRPPPGRPEGASHLIYLLILLRSTRARTAMTPTLPKIRAGQGTSWPALFCAHSQHAVTNSRHRWRGDMSTRCLSPGKFPSTHGHLNFSIACGTRPRSASPVGCGGGGSIPRPASVPLRYRWQVCSRAAPA